MTALLPPTLDTAILNTRSLPGGQTGSCAKVCIKARTAANAATIVEMSGVLDSTTSGEALDEMVRLIRDRHHRIVLNLEYLESMTRAGSRAIVVTSKLAKSFGGAMTICNPNRAVEQGLKASGFNNLLKIYENEETAVAALRLGVSPIRP
jgi:anti-anti-sigma factor